ncbi:MAG: branched-chain-amino-acid transaminase [bacterium]|nr:branched-chain-amino-acid transaminase [bacterium]MDD5354134.1 branched-chain-amino-acid transaminase [bacterium]MDD5757028.1 branched-chain-amino-acid transaminase [bacterium]
MGLKIYLDGKMVPKENAKISVFDHGILYGDGVFEGIRAYNGRVFRLSEHLLRLYNSAKAINLNCGISLDRMEEVVLKTLRINKLKDAYIRLVVTRGVGDLGLDPRKCPKPTIFCITDKISLYPEEYYREGLTIVTASTRKNIPESLNPRIKSLNYLNSILAKMEAALQNAPEAIMLTKDGYVAECTGDNIFILKDNVLKTPPSYLGALEGVTREVVMELAARNRIACREEVFTRYDLFTADECFLTGTAAEVVPVVRIDGRPIGTGKPGKITSKLIKEFKALTLTEGVEIY